MNDPSTLTSTHFDSAPVFGPSPESLGQAVIARTEDALERIEHLSELLVADTCYTIEPPDFELPAGFKLSIVVPVYNEAATILEILSRLAILPVCKEIVIVDDCSTDGTRALLKPVESTRDVRVIYKPKNEGKGAALRTGFAAATGDIVVIQDADLEYDPRDILPLLKPIVAGEADVVFGSRFLGEAPQDPSLVHRLGNRLLTAASNLFTRQQLTDMETCYKAFRRESLSGIEIQQNRFGFEPEITAKLARRRARIQEVPIRYDARSYADGKKIGWKDAFNAFYCIVRYGLAD